jgi:hypothetical protein
MNGHDLLVEGVEVHQVLVHVDAGAAPTASGLGALALVDAGRKATGGKWCSGAVSNQRLQNLAVVSVLNRCTHSQATCGSGTRQTRRTSVSPSE